jgi:hypothetical protein
VYRLRLEGRCASTDFIPQAARLYRPLPEHINYYHHYSLPTGLLSADFYGIDIESTIVFVIYNDSFYAVLN